jgi:hypothetical protein
MSISVQVLEYYQQRLKHLESESLIEYEKQNTKKKDDVELFANDPYLYGYYSLMYILDVIEPDENEQVLVFPKMQEIEDYQTIYSIWELFCNLIVTNKTILSSKGEHMINAKEILMSHFIETQNQRPEFVFNLIMLYLQEQQYQKVKQLIDQFKLQDIQA